MQATLQWKQDLVFDAITENGQRIQLDGSHSTGPAPIELVLLAQGGCTGMDVMAILQKKRQTITALEVKLDGIRQEEHPQVFTEITITYLIRGRGVDPQAVERAIELSETKYCPVMAMLRKATTITTRYEIIEEPAG